MPSRARPISSLSRSDTSNRRWWIRGSRGGKRSRREYPSLRCYEIPVIATRWSPVRAVIDGGMAQAVRAHEARRRTLTVYTDVRRVTDGLAIDATDTVTHVTWRVARSSFPMLSRARPNLVVVAFPTRSPSDGELVDDRGGRRHGGGSQPAVLRNSGDRHALVARPCCYRRRYGSGVRRAGGTPSHAHGLHRHAAHNQRARDERHRCRDLLLVDADGRLRWRTTGPVSEHSGSELRAALTADSSQDAGVRNCCRSSSSSSSSTRSSVRSSR